MQGVKGRANVAFQLNLFEVALPGGVQIWHMSTCLACVLQGSVGIGFGRICLRGILSLQSVGGVLAPLSYCWHKYTLGTAHTQQQLDNPLP